jgi:hypothetical protein
MPAESATAAPKDHARSRHESSGTPTNLTDLIDRMTSADPDGDKVELGDVLDTIGNRSFAPLLVVMGLIVVSPLSGIPGLPSTIGLVVVLISGQLIFGGRRFWLPAWVRHRGISRQRYLRALNFMRRPARIVDRLLKPRLEFIVSKVGFSLILTICIVVAITMPVMEPVPFAASIAGLALAGFGLALLAHDGLVALVSFAYTLTATWIVVSAIA